jgi:poly(3-hydroxyoctanoate) depolymerase
MPWRLRAGSSGQLLERRVGLIDIDGVPWRVATVGAGPPLLLVNGIGAAIETWAPLEPHLAGFTVVSFDAPGAGRSGPVHPLLPMRALATRVVELLDRQGHEQLDVLGYSWGGALAQQLAYQAPERVRRLVLCGTTCGLGGTPGSPRAFAALAPRPGRPPNLVGYTGQLLAIARWTSLPWLHQIGQPTLVLAGGEDPVVPLGNARLLARRIPDSRIHVVDGAGHLFMIDQAEAMAELVRWFLEASDGELAATAGLSLASVPPKVKPRLSRRAQGLRHRVFTRGPRC